nr:glycosyltransferase [Conexibacter sp. SYSU D00693]
MLSTYGSRGDVEPLVGLAVELQAMGAEVQVCAPPDEDFVERLAGIGVALVGVGPSARALTRAAPPPTSIPERAAQIVADQVRAIAPVAEGADALVATGMVPAAAGALSVAEAVGVPAVSVTFQQLTLPAAHRRPLAYPGHPLPPGETDHRVLWRHDREAINDLFRDGLNASRATLGLVPVDDVRGYVLGDRPWLASDPVLDPWIPTPGLEIVQTGAWFAPSDGRLAPEVERFLDAGDPPVYVGFGSMPMHAAADVAQVALAAVRAHGRRAVLLRGWADLTAVEGDDVLVVGEVDQAALFGRVAAAVHHGGAGTTLTATRAGVPQVVVAQAADQPYWAGRVADLGIGAAHDGPAPTVASLTAALEVALAPEVRERAAAVAAHVRTDGAAVAARLLVDVVERDRLAVTA